MSDENLNTKLINNILHFPIVQLFCCDIVVVYLFYNILIMQPICKYFTVSFVFYTIEDHVVDILTLIHTHVCICIVSLCMFEGVKKENGRKNEISTIMEYYQKVQHFQCSN